MINDDKEKTQKEKNDGKTQCENEMHKHNGLSHAFGRNVRQRREKEKKT